MNKYKNIRTYSHFQYFLSQNYVEMKKIVLSYLPCLWNIHVSHVMGFVPHFEAKEPTVYKCLSNDSYFWRDTRSKEDIIEFISNVLPSMNTKRDVEVLSSEPPLIIIHDFISNQFCNYIIQAAIKQGGLIRSSLGATKEESEERTSSNTVSLYVFIWCVFV